MLFASRGALELRVLREQLPDAFVGGWLLRPPTLLAPLTAPTLHRVHDVLLLLELLRDEIRVPESLQLILEVIHLGVVRQNRVPDLGGALAFAVDLHEREVFAGFAIDGDCGLFKGFGDAGFHLVVLALNFAGLLTFLEGLGAWHGAASVQGEEKTFLCPSDVAPTMQVTARSGSAPSGLRFHIEALAVKYRHRQFPRRASWPFQIRCTDGPFPLC